MVMDESLALVVSITEGIDAFETPMLRVAYADAERRLRSRAFAAFHLLELLSM
jgi:hypothetical protein